MQKKLVNDYSNTGTSPRIVKVHHSSVRSYSQCILQYLFAQFVKAAEAKINEALNHSLVIKYLCFV